MWIESGRPSHTTNNQPEQLSRGYKDTILP